MDRKKNKKVQEFMFNLLKFRSKATKWTINVFFFVNNINSKIGMFIVLVIKKVEIEIEN